MPFPHAPHYRPEEFLPAASNAEAMLWLGNTASWPGRQLALWGPEGCGKTHLLHVWAAREGAALLSGPMLVLPPPPRPLAIDDADTAAPRTLLHVLNSCREAGLPALLAAREAPARWPCALPDLASRLRAMPAVPLRPADETLLAALFDHLARERQMPIAASLRDWMLLRLPRSQAAVREAVARLDHAALAAGGRVTRPLAQGVVAALGGEAPEEAAATPDRAAAGVSAAGRLL